MAKKLNMNTLQSQLKKFNATTLGLVVLSLVLWPCATHAAVLRAGESVSIANDQVVPGDFYALSGEVSHSGLVEGDLHAAAGSFTQNGEVQGDVGIIGGSVQMHAPVGDDVRVLGGDVTIASDVAGDVVVLGGVLKILSTAHVAGDIMFFGGDLEVLGPVDGSVLGTAEVVRIDSVVGQSVDVNAGQLSLGDRAEVMGDVRYTSGQPLARGQNAVVLGEIVENKMPAEVAVSYENYLVSFIVILAAALILQLVFRTQLMRALPLLSSSIGISGVIGMATLVLTPALIASALLSVIGLSIGAILLFLFLLLLFTAIPLTSIVIGAFVGRALQKEPTLNVLYTVIGAVLLHVLFLVPFFGPVIIFVSFFVTLGILVRVLYGYIRA